MPTIAPIVSVADLSDHPDAVIADVRWYLDGRSGRAAFESGHLPGAVFVDLEHDLAGPNGGPATDGRHPFPDPASFALAMGRLGIGDTSTVIAYDDTGGMTAGRLVVMLRMLGREAALLDGGLGAWSGQLRVGVGAALDPLVFTPQSWPADRLADADTTANLAASGRGIVLDARAHERFTGAVTAIDPRPGHIPGAVSAPWADNLDPSSHVKSVEQLRTHYAQLGLTSGDANESGDPIDRGEVVVHCGSGVSACLDILAIEHAGLPPARLFVASFSGWSNDPDRPVVVGE